MNEVACRIRVDLSTPERIEAMKKQINHHCLGGFSFVAVDKNDVVIGFQLAERKYWYDELYIHLTYAGVTAATANRKSSDD